ncbi:MAG: GntR family transcriptional regulator [Andreesenia angusta]|nr:GntR family transcriptional regulator [Andreesenia angusta]
MYDLKSKDKPVYIQIVEQTIEMIVKGELDDNDKLPSVRELAIQLGINPSTVSKAYKELDEMGFIKTEKGKGTFILFSEKGLDIQKNKLLSEIEEKIERAKSIGIESQEIRKIIDRLYEEG